MARQLRIQYPGAFYHVTSRGNDRQNIYRDKEDYEEFLERLIESLDVYNVSLLCYVCMTNHFHFLLTTPDANLSHFMRHFNIGYTAAFNRRHKRSGHLYQGRYKSFLIDADSYLKEVSRYVHLNPVRLKKYTGLDAKEKVMLLKKSSFNSLAGYTNLKKRESFLNYSTILDYFGGDTEEGRRQYRQFVNKGLGDDLENPLASGRGTGIVGADSFVETIRDKFLLNTTRESKREQPQLKEVKKKYGPEELINHFCSIVNVEIDYICSRGKNTTDRAMLMEMLYRHCKITQPKIGRLMGIDYSSVSYARKRLRGKISKSSILKIKFDRINDELTKLKK